MEGEVSELGRERKREKERRGGIYFPKHVGLSEVIWGRTWCLISDLTNYRESRISHRLED